MFTSLLAHLNWLHIFVAALAYFTLGALWYSKLLFANPWVKGHGINMMNPDAQKGVAGIMIGSFVLMFLTTTGVAILQQLMPAYQLDATHAIKYGLLIGALFSASTISVGYLYTKKPFSVHVIDGLYHIVGISIAGLVMAVWK